MPFNPATIKVETNVVVAKRHRATSDSYNPDKNPFFKELRDSKAEIDAGKPETAGRAITVPASDAREAYRWIRDASGGLKMSARIDMFGLRYKAGTKEVTSRVPVALGKQSEGQEIITKSDKQNWTGDVRLEFCAAEFKPRNGKNKKATTPATGNSTAEPASDPTPSVDAAGTEAAPSDAARESDNAGTAPTTDKTPGTSRSRRRSA